jgi:hypothetical protein
MRNLTHRTDARYRSRDNTVVRLREALRGDIYAVLGNHVSITTVPDLEALGIRVLLNECVAINRGGASIYLPGVDDAHFYRADNIEMVAAGIPQGCVSVLLHVLQRPCAAVSSGQIASCRRRYSCASPGLRNILKA